MLASILNAVGKRFWPIWHARHLGVSVGEGCRLIRCEFSTEPYLIKIGNHVSATAVRFETHDGGVWCIRGKHTDIDRVKPIIIGNNVYIGYNALILPGVSVGDNSIIGAYSVVSRDIPSGVVAAGVPARVIKGLSDYGDRALEDGAMTKSMSPKEKKSFYIKKYFGQ